MKVKQNGVWKNLGGIDVEKFGNYTLLTPDMVSGTMGNNSQRYVGTATHIIIDDSWGIDNLQYMFNSNQIVESVIILKNSITNLRNFCADAYNLKFIFADTSNVTDMRSMFSGNEATTLDLSSFDTSNVTNMSNMFNNIKTITTLDLSSFDTSKVTNMKGMFSNSLITTGYARTQADADRFNASSGKPAGLTFVVK